MTDEQKQQEMMFRLSLFEQQIRQLQQQIQAVEQAVIEMNSLNFGLDELVGKKGEEIMASVGKGIFARAKLISEDLVVDVGGKNFVTKTIPQTKEMISNQIIRLQEAQTELEKELNNIGKEVEKVWNSGSEGLK